MKLIKWINNNVHDYIKKRFFNQEIVLKFWLLFSFQLRAIIKQIAKNRRDAAYGSDDDGSTSPLANGTASNNSVASNGTVTPKPHSTLGNNKHGEFCFNAL